MAALRTIPLVSGFFGKTAHQILASSCDFHIGIVARDNVIVRRNFFYINGLFLAYLARESAAASVWSKRIGGFPPFIVVNTRISAHILGAGKELRRFPCPYVPHVPPYPLVARCPGGVKGESRPRLPPIQKKTKRTQADATRFLPAVQLEAVGR